MIYKTLLISQIFLISFAINAEAMVWKLQNKDKVIFIGGTVHCLRKSDYPLPDEYQIVYDKVEQVIFEASIKEMYYIANQIKLTKKGFYLNGETLKDNISSETYKKLLKFLKKKNLPFATYAKMKPWMVMMVLTIQEFEKINVTAFNGVEYYINAKAMKDNKKEGGLESVDEHIGILSSLENKIGDEAILSCIEELDNIEEEFNKIITTWKSGDIKAMDNFFVKKMKDKYKGLYNALLFNRNKNWVPRIIKLIESQEKTFILVGSAHLVGEDSLIKLLQEKGYSFKKFNPIDGPLSP